MNPNDATLTMPTLSMPSPSSVQCERLAEVLDAYLQDLEKGRKVDVQRLLAEHADLAAPLRECLSGMRFLQQAGAVPGVIPDALALDHLGDYEILREIGRGGMGIVYEARQVTLDRRVALKVLPMVSLLSDKQAARFASEARAAAQLQHPHIIPVYSAGVEDGIHFYSMRYIDGQPLSQWIRQWRGTPTVPVVTAASTLSLSAALGACRSGDAARLDPAPAGVRGPGAWAHWRKVARLGIQAAEALHYAHQNGVVHRDIKPSNLLLDTDESLWIGDFGLARCENEVSLTTTGRVLGTVNYMSPEQAAGRGDEVDHRTDIYSLGVTLYEMLTLCEARTGNDRHDILRRIIEEEPPQPRRINPGIPVDLETIVLKATARLPAARYATARDLAEDLQRFLEGRPILARRATLAEHVTKWASRHKTFVHTAVALLLAGVLAMTVATVLIASAHSKTRAALIAAEEAIREKDEALGLSEKHRQRSEQWFREAREVLNRLAKRHADDLGELPQADRLRQELLQDSIEYYRRFIREAADDPALRGDLAVAEFQTARLIERIPRPREALDAYHRSLAILERLARERPADRDLEADIALCRNNMGLLLLQMGRSAEARDQLSRAAESQRSLVERSPGMERFRHELALSLGNLASLHQRQGDTLSAEKAFRESLALCETLVQRRPGEARFLAQLAMTSNDLGLLLVDGRPAEAESLCRQAVTQAQALVAVGPKHREYRMDLALCQSNLGTLLKRLGRFDQAEVSYKAAIKVYQELCRGASISGRYPCELATAYSNLGSLHLASRRPEAANDAFQEGRKILEGLVAETPEVINYRSYLGGLLNNQGTALARLGRDGPAEQAYREGLKHQRYAVEHAPQIKSLRKLLAGQYAVLSRYLREKNRIQEAETVEAASRESLGG